MKNILILFLLLFSFGLSAQIINDNTDVNTSSPENNEVLNWQDSVWVNSPLSDLPLGIQYPYSSVSVKDVVTDGNITGFTAFNAGVVSFSSGALRVVGSSADKGTEYSSFTHTANQEYTIRLDVADAGSGIKVNSQWPTQVGAIYSSGVYFIDFTSPAGNGTFGKEVILSTVSGPDTFFINRIDIFEKTPSPFALNPSTQNNIDTVGRNIIVNFSPSGTAQNGAVLIRGTAAGNDDVTIGKGAKGQLGTNTPDVAIGLDAYAEYTAEFSSYWGGASGPEKVAIGETSRAMAWRATAIGGNAYAGTTSSTALGAGSTSLQVHGTAVGRGAYVPRSGIANNVGTVLGGDLAHNLYIANTWGHQFNLPPAGISISSYATPSTNEVKFHGHDALDAREECWLVGNTYASGDYVQDANKVYKSLTAGNTGNTPASNPANWVFVYDTSGGCPSSYNVDAGDVGIYSGKATGTGTSGSINLYVAEGNNGQNTKDTPKKAMELRSDEAATTGTFLWLLNEATGTMQRVIIDTKPAVSGTNGIVGFSKGYRPE